MEPIPDQASIKAGTKVTSLYDYDGTEEGSLVFTAGETFTITFDVQDAELWYECETADGRTGVVPGNYVEVIRERPEGKMEIERPQGKVEIHLANWLHGKINRQKVARLLSSGAEGLYLIRESTKFAGEYTLSMNSHQSPAGGPDHYTIKRRQQKFTIDGANYFISLHELIEYYEVPGRSGLETHLREFVSSSEACPPWYVKVKDLENLGMVIKKADVTVQTSVTEGEFSDVSNGKYSNTDVTIKTRKERDALLIEAAIMTNLEHCNVEQFVGFVNQKPFYLVAECLWGGCLLDNLRDPGQVDLNKLLTFARETCCGMCHLEERGVVHCDLAVRNLMLTESGTVKISNFHLSRPTSLGYVRGNEKFAVKWTAPDALKSRYFTSESDVWSYGVVLWELFTRGQTPYTDIALSEVIKTVQQGYRLPAPEDCPNKVQQLINAAWHKRPNKRPRFSTILNDLSNLVI